MKKKETEAAGTVSQPFFLAPVWVWLVPRHPSCGHDEHHGDTVLILSSHQSKGYQLPTDLLVFKSRLLLLTLKSNTNDIVRVWEKRRAEIGAKPNIGFHPHLEGHGVWHVTCTPEMLVVLDWFGGVSQAMFPATLYTYYSSAWPFPSAPTPRKPISLPA